LQFNLDASGFDQPQRKHGFADLHGQWLTTTGPPSHQLQRLSGDKAKIGQAAQNRRMDIRRGGHQALNHRTLAEGRSEQKHS